MLLTESSLSQFVLYLSSLTAVTDVGPIVLVSF